MSNGFFITSPLIIGRRHLLFVLHKKTYNASAVNNSNANKKSLKLPLVMFYLAEQMPRGDFLGSLEQIVMLAVMRLARMRTG